MPKNDDFQETFKQLKAIFKPYATKLHVVHDTDSHYYLDTHLVMKNKHRLFFGAVKTGKAYVSFHLMPVYASPELQKSISPELKKRMQGKSCFNFKTPDEKLFRELGQLTKAGFEKFHDPDFLQKIFTRRIEKR
jgi:pentose-5-phosphate-3-epimerase